MKLGTLLKPGGPRAFPDSETFMKALTIDDDPDFLKILETHLKGVGYSTRAIQTPSDILNAINENKYDLVLVDWMMPEVDGITVI